MKKFEIGKTYSFTHIGDHNLTVSYVVIDRTENSVTLQNGNEVMKKRISKGLSEHCGAEAVYPQGKFALCPILTA